MSAALIRQALEFVDPDETSDNRKKRGGRRAKTESSSGQVLKSQHSNRSSKRNLKPKDRALPEEAVKKLLQLSSHAVDTDTAEKIIKRACSGKPLTEEIRVDTTEQQQSILFPG